MTRNYDAQYIPRDAGMRGHWETITATSMSAAQKVARQHAAANDWRLFQIVPSTIWAAIGTNPPPNQP